MFKNTIAVLQSLIFIIISISCKNDMNVPVKMPDSQRKIRFQLSTTKDFSSFNDSITFKIFIRNTSHKTLWDSTFKAVKLNQIPTPKDKWIVEKIVPNEYNSVLQVGFNYSIKNVGNSWYLDTCDVGNKLKIVDFNFL
jgi:hypothetical protein